MSGIAAAQISDKAVHGNQVPTALVPVFRLIILAKVCHNIFIDFATCTGIPEGVRYFLSHRTTWVGINLRSFNPCQ